MGELPADAPLKPGAARWAIPLVLVAVVAVAAVYEIARPPAAPANPTAIDKAAIPAAAVAEAAPVPTQPSTTTSLPNPLIAANANADVKPDLKPAIARENENSGRDPDSGAVPAPAVATAESASAPTAAGPVALKFHGTSWVEVRDATGAIVAQLTGRAGDTQAVNGRAPFDVILGNAAAADVTWQGQPFDTTPYTRQNVARFTLR